MEFHFRLAPGRATAQHVDEATPKLRAEGKDEGTDSVLQHG